VCVQWLPILPCEPCELITSNYFELPHMKCPDCSDNQIGAISKQDILCYTIMNYHEIQWFYIYSIYIYDFEVIVLSPGADCLSLSHCSLWISQPWPWSRGLRDGWWMLMNKMPTHGRIPVLICINWIQLVHDQPKNHLSCQTPDLGFQNHGMSFRHILAC